MMWIFDRRVAELRKKYHIIVGVLYDHEESTLARRKAKILKTDCPITFPLDPFQEALVEIEYTDHKSRLKRKFVRPANLNPESRSSAKAPLVVTSGEHKGKLAHNMRTNGGRSDGEGRGNKREGSLYHSQFYANWNSQQCKINVDVDVNRTCNFVIGETE